MNNESMVYLNKVFSDVRINSCPLMSSLTATADNFDQQLTFFDGTANDRDCDHGCGHGCGCSCSCSCNCNCGCGGESILGSEGDLNFVIDSTEVIVSEFDLANPSCISPCNVTVDGIPVDGLDFFNERYMAATNELMTRIGDCACMERGLSTKGYFLIAGIGGFRAKLTVVLRGSVFGCGVCKRFKLLMTTKNNVYVNIPGQSTFAVSELCLPCTTGGIAPIINFSFSAKANLLNPIICVDESSTACSLTVTGCLVAEPVADVQVTRQTLFRTSAESVNVPCDDLERCRQNPGVCGDEDDDSNALQLRNRCCEDGNTAGNGNGSGSCGGNSGCGCGHHHDDDGCGCGHHHDDGGCGCSGSRGGSRAGNSISFQFNGRNGCSF